jgi:hypothetical protein
MTREMFLLVFVLGSGALAVWVVFCLPKLAPQSLKAAAGHVVAALAVGYALAPALRMVPGQPARISVLTALFAVALPALTYMLLAGLWLLKLFAGNR